MGTVKKIYIAAERRDPVVPINEAYLEKHKGIVGDRYHFAAEQALAEGKEAPDNQVTLIAAEVLDEFVARHDADLDYGAFRRSIVTEGIELNDLVGRDFTVGDARCTGVELCEPCRWLAHNVHPAVLPDLAHRAGIRAVVKRSGKIKPGSRIKTA